jgi:hypothetical protein
MEQERREAYCRFWISMNERTIFNVDAHLRWLRTEEGRMRGSRWEIEVVRRPGFLAEAAVPPLFFSAAGSQESSSPRFSFPKDRVLD